MSEHRFQSSSFVTLSLASCSQCHSLVCPALQLGSHSAGQTVKVRPFADEGRGYCPSGFEGNGDVAGDISTPGVALAQDRVLQILRQYEQDTHRGVDIWQGPESRVQQWNSS